MADTGFGEKRFNANSDYRLFHVGLICTPTQGSASEYEKSDCPCYTYLNRVVFGACSTPYSLIDLQLPGPDLIERLCRKMTIRTVTTSEKYSSGEHSFLNSKEVLINNYLEFVKPNTCSLNS